jgi:hypothetical protein
VLEEVRVASALTTLRTRWSTDSETPAEVISRLAPVALAIIWAVVPGEDEPAADVQKALGSFERWYSESRRASFWSLFEHQMPDTPRIDL